ncbi:hypothetical protein [Pseudomonas alkylphenolica]|uniref:hypothetical protein n=1 Tax=Pseudomonas alkylphenolica TaxID=237609 RepID=UPI00315D09A3
MPLLNFSTAAIPSSVCWRFSALRGRQQKVCRFLLLIRNQQVEGVIDVCRDFVVSIMRHKLGKRSLGRPPAAPEGFFKGCISGLTPPPILGNVAQIRGI